MKVIHQIAHFQKPKYAAVTIGTFDGVHIGHQTILNQLIADAKQNQGQSILITFWPHPQFILKKNNEALELLSTFNEKMRLLEQLGLDCVIKIPFTPQFSNLSAESFVQNILVKKTGTKKLWIGYDHHFGKNREGNIDYLRSVATKYGYQVQEIPRQEIDNVGVSSTKIRNHLHNGQVQLAKVLLDRYYSVTGRVVHGNKTGRKIGFPTANIEVQEDYKLLPGDGAYVIQATLENTVSKNTAFNGMLNIGFKPTVNGIKRTMEAHLFNFNEDIYDYNITIKFIRSLRKEKKFNSIDELRMQLNEDKSNAMHVFS